MVALRKESVDRNNGGVKLAGELYVALRKESVDRNFAGLAALRRCLVALRKESVDRNLGRPPRHHPAASSLSARRAWIEIPLCTSVCLSNAPSLSARRAWIEMALT